MDAMTCLLGAFTTSLSLYLAWWFASVRHDLGVPLAMMLGAEAFAGLVTTIFAVTAAVNGGHTWLLPHQQMALRWALFLTTSVTSLHLAWKLHEISDG